jgi:vacuolar-type H+-ATPase subunit C/Vma6
VAQGYDYGNARLRAMRSRLLKAANYHYLLNRKTPQELITALMETPYQADLEVALTQADGVSCILAATRLNLSRTLHLIRDFYEAEPRALIDLLLQQWDYHNLLTILRGQSQEVPAEKVLAVTIPVGQLDQVTLRELARQPGLRATLDLLTIWRLPYAKALRRVQPVSGAIPELEQLELALAQAHYSAIEAALAQSNGNGAILRQHFQGELDLLNLRTALRLLHQPEVIPLVQQRYQAINTRALFIEPGGRLSPQHLAELVAQANSIEGLIHLLAGTIYGPALAAGWRRYQAGEGGLTVFERELERWQAEQFAAMFTANPLSSAIPIGYIGCKQIEVANLRLIAQAVALGLNRAQVEHDLIIG